jgi:hypothetical protein
MLVLSVLLYHKSIPIAISNATVFMTLILIAGIGEAPEKRELGLAGMEEAPEKRELGLSSKRDVFEKRGLRLTRREGRGERGTTGGGGVLD